MPSKKKYSDDHDTAGETKTLFPGNSCPSEDTQIGQNQHLCKNVTYDSDWRGGIGAQALWSSRGWKDH